MRSFLIGFDSCKRFLRSIGTQIGRREKIGRLPRTEWANLREVGLTELELCLKIILTAIQLTRPKLGLGRLSRDFVPALFTWLYYLNFFCFLSPINVLIHRYSPKQRNRKLQLYLDLSFVQNPRITNHKYLQDAFYTQTCHDKLNYSSSLVLVITFSTLPKVDLFHLVRSLPKRCKVRLMFSPLTFLGFDLLLRIFSSHFLSLDHKLGSR